MAHFVQCIGNMFLHSLDLSFNQITPTMDRDIIQRIAEKGGEYRASIPVLLLGRGFCLLLIAHTLA